MWGCRFCKPPTIYLAPPLFMHFVSDEPRSSTYESVSTSILCLLFITFHLINSSINLIYAAAVITMLLFLDPSYSSNISNHTSIAASQILSRSLGRRRSDDAFKNTTQLRITNAIKNTVDYIINMLKLRYNPSSREINTKWYACY